MIALILTIAGIQSEHAVSSFVYAYPGYWTYVEGGQTFVVKGQSYYFDINGLRVSGEYVRTDTIKKDSFEGREQLATLKPGLTN